MNLFTLMAKRCIVSKPPPRQNMNNLQKNTKKHNVNESKGYWFTIVFLN